MNKYSIANNRGMLVILEKKKYNMLQRISWWNDFHHRIGSEGKNSDEWDKFEWKGWMYFMRVEKFSFIQETDVGVMLVVRL